ncbi:carbohydrate binding domain-containing protein [Paenibacillus tyrfis]|uniref:CBM-cenC domain-containing protein n=1 Tax=Paenibacillus tyrfis TaxID=1501230 RepID=A0A081P430_9BACL|nr:hypothetical protein [Paenibacillus tyrfis]KEQ25453.1 hypothetical protein ET33_01650 [Paenibacillus tyrfis]
MHIFQDTMVKSGTTFSLSGRLRISELMNAKASVFVYFYDAAYNLLGSENIAEYKANTDYTSLVGSFTTPAGTTQARVHIRLDALAKGGGGTLHADSFAIKKESAANLLINGGYEESTGIIGVADNWNAYADPGINPAYQVVTWPVSAGQRAQKLAASNIPSGGLHIFQDTMVKSGTTYSLSGRLRINDLMNAKASVFVYFYDAAYNLLGSENIAEYKANMDYTSLIGSFKTPAGTTQARVHIRLDALAKGGGGTLYVDEVSMID